ncbi:30S ribosomal protein S16 [Pantoea sp. SoEX]|uniref:30S ribosomal protein S16 n=1 Tax=Pantoea sp. SoEX TaxID=2576763 RepID=UPI001356B195|nr:30S ribosomal protein S16 [Pantoea sp. SoEX]MXP51241.1 30S ribosomal protein S16 [Pantoea sp. SoEX]
MVVIRLARHGSKKRPFYQLVVTDSRKARNGRFIENVGFYNPVNCGSQQRVSLDEKRIKYWISNGAKLSNKVNNLLKLNKNT